MHDALVGVVAAFREPDRAQRVRLVGDGDANPELVLQNRRQLKIESTDGQPLLVEQVLGRLIKDIDVESMVLYAEHSFNASTFAARVVTSTRSDIYSAVTAAIGALKGSLHGGANEAVMYDMIEIDRPERARQWMNAKLDAKEKVMGFGHRVYKNGDSRVPTMRAALEDVATHVGDGRWLRIYDELEAVMGERTGIKPNLDFPTGPAYHLMGFDIPSFTPIFVMSRITGWTARIMEQAAANALIRPLSEYSGPSQRPVVG